ncbi:MAG TPA: acyltransferase, partial [Ornithinibacter sp.]|nr:acyltransferase [Ornithinibacter sp.]
MSTVQAHGDPDTTAPGTGDPVGARGDAARSRSRGTLLPGLDGLRALAITAVLVFHLDPTWLPGGFLGVDVFFVVSGFLITTLLVRERTTTGTVDLPGFWTRRARRLLPALLVCVPASVLLARLTEGDLLVGVGRQVAGAFTFTSNWLEIAAGSDYFAATSPQLFMNLWSLAVEEQFYLVWPIAVLLLVALVRRPEARAATALGIAVVSSVLMAVRLDAESPTRVYFGTDTHVMGLMLGAALAFAWAAPHRAWTTTPWWAAHRRHVAVAALATLGSLLAVASETSALTFRGGILLASVATTALVLVVVERPGRLRAVLEVPLARWLGARSYGVYLWHWPVFLVIGQDLPVAPGSATYALTRLWCVVVTLVVADLSYRLVEMPVRRHGFAGSGARVLRRLRGLGTRGARVVWSV